MINLESKSFQIKDYKTKQEMLSAIGSYKADCIKRYEGKCCFDVKKEENGFKVIVGLTRDERENVRTRDNDDEGMER